MSATVTDEVEYRTLLDARSDRDDAWAIAKDYAALLRKLGITNLCGIQVRYGRGVEHGVYLVTYPGAAGAGGALAASPHLQRRLATLARHGQPPSVN